MVFIPWELLQPWLEANKVPIACVCAGIVAVIVAVVVWWRRSSASQDVERRFMQRMAGDMEWFEEHMLESFSGWVDRCGEAYVKKQFSETAAEWNEMHEMVQSEQVSGGRGNLLEMLKGSRVPVLTEAMVKQFDEFVKAGTLSSSFNFLMKAAKNVWLAKREGPVPDSIGKLEDEVKFDWAMVFIDDIVLKSNGDKLALFPFLAEVKMTGQEYHMLEIIVSHVVSVFQRNYIKTWVADHAEMLDAKPYRLHHPDEILRRVVAILDAEAKKAE
ncbi:uncharacterized protein AMSG_07004 [Thecamonas trahens ATCC 50062]|uniref:Uncharacterized protein n=1 Tax=Thecamonas trahens ATCC 50062 TaxID=461836 RepID=A0A0L0DF99_THETB|nr:hypothetical protein AMSG_07004 [Thecamonas trahens ATCC 50062]KNC51027.1 hypothetical protein AMSG_07004 [Thecamonas trahens ATCC 50062]|eukprot:XP_013756494.1 hypothetical protein AMSG_07004 [Thecamonas trahens ATCC 50062]